MGLRDLLAKNSNSELLETSPLNERLLQAFEKYAEQVLKMGYQNKVYSEAALRQLAVLPEEKKVSITEFLELSLQWANTSLETQGVLSPKNYLSQALEYYGLAMDENFLKVIDKDTVVEIYSEDMIQLYRSFNLLDMTGYSLLDLSVFEWYVLWERPHLVIEQMQSQCAQILSSQVPFKNFAVVSHILKETYNMGMTEPFVPRSCMVKFEHIGYLKRLREDSPHAFICTAKGNIIAEGFAETNQLAFL